MSLTDAFPSRLARGVVVVLFLMAAGFGVSLRFANEKLDREKQLNYELTQERDSAKAETKTLLNAVTLNNDVSQATNVQKATVNQDAQKSVVYIRERVSADVCANTVIDRSATQRLYAYADGLRKSASGPAAR